MGWRMKPAQQTPKASWTQAPQLLPEPPGAGSPEVNWASPKSSEGKSLEEGAGKGMWAGGGVALGAWERGGELGWVGMVQGPSWTLSEGKGWGPGLPEGGGL